MLVDDVYVMYIEWISNVYDVVRISHFYDFIQTNSHES